MNRKEEDRPRPRNILGDEFLTPDKLMKMQETQIKLRGKMSPSPSMDKNAGREFIIETDSREISRISIVTRLDQPIIQGTPLPGLIKFEKTFNIKLMKMKYNAFCRMIGQLKKDQQKRWAAKAMGTFLDWKRKQRLISGLRHLLNNCKSKSRWPSYIANLSRIIHRLRIKNTQGGFRQVRQIQLNYLQQQSQSASQQASHQTSQQSLQLNLDPNDPKRLKASSSSSRFVRKPSPGNAQNLTERKGSESNNKQLEQLKSMSLSVEARQALIKMQRFDRFIYAQESQKVLKGPIDTELRRLEKIKNMDKSLRNIYFDNQLTITVLYNHIKTLYELNRQLGQMESIKEQCKTLENKIIEVNMNKAKEIKEIQTNMKKPADQNTRLKQLDNQLKDNRKLNETLYQTIREGGFERAKKMLEVQIKRHQNETNKELSIDRKEMLEILQQLLPIGGNKTETKVETAVGLNISELKSDLGSLLQAQSALEKNLTYLEKVKKLLDTKENEAKTSDSRELYALLAKGAAYISSLYTDLKSKNSEVSDLNRKLGEIERQRQRTERIKSQSQQKGQTAINRLKADLENERSKSKDLQKRLGQLNRSMKNQKEKQTQSKQFQQNDSSIKQWQAQLVNIVSKIEKDEKNWYVEAQRQRKLLNSKRVTDKFSHLIGLNLSLLEAIIKRDKMLEQNTQQISRVKLGTPNNENKLKDAQDKLQKERDRVKQLTQQRNNLKKQLAEQSKSDKPDKKDLLANELAQINKVTTNIEQIFAKANKSEQQPVFNDWPRIRKLIDRRKYNNLLPVITLLETLIRMISQLEENERKRLNEASKTEGTRTRQMNSLAQLNKAVQRVIQEKGLKIDGQALARIKKLLEINAGKYEKASESYDTHLCNMLKDATLTEVKLLKLIESDREALATEVEQLQSYISQVQTQLKNDKSSSQKIIQQNTLKITNLEKSLKELQAKYDETHKEESSTIQKLTTQKNQLTSRIEKRQKDVTRLEQKIKTLELKQNEHLKEIKEFKEAIDMYSKEERAMLTAIEVAENESRSLRTQIQILSAGAGQQEQERAKAQQNRNELAKAQQKVTHLQKELGIREQQIKKADQQHKAKAEDWQRQLKNIENNMNRLLQQNAILQTEKQELQKQLQANQARTNQSQSLLASQNVRLYGQVGRMQERLSTLQRSGRNMEQQNLRLRQEYSLQNDERLNLTNRIQKIQKELEQFRAENAVLLTGLDETETQVNRLREKLKDTERELRQRIQSGKEAQEYRESGLAMLEDLKNEVRRKDEQFLRRDREMNTEQHRLNLQIQSKQKEIQRLSQQLNVMEQYVTQLQQQHEIALNKRSKSHNSELEQIQAKLKQKARQELSALQLQNSTLQGTVNNLKSQLSRQQEHYEKVIDHNKKLQDSKERGWQREISGLQNQIVRYQNSIKAIEEANRRTIDKNQQTAANKTKLLENQISKLRTEIQNGRKEMTEGKTLVQQQLVLEIQKVQQHYQRLLNDESTRRKEEDTKFKTELRNLSQTNSELTMEMSRLRFEANRSQQLNEEINRLKVEVDRLHRQSRESQQNYNVQHEKAMSTIREELAATRNDLTAARNEIIRQQKDFVPVNVIQEELRKQEEYFRGVLDQNTLLFQQQEEKMLKEITNLRSQLESVKVNADQTALIRKLENDIKKQEAEIKRLDGQIKKKDMELVTQRDNGKRIEDEKKKFQDGLRLKDEYLKKTESDIRNLESNLRRLEADSKKHEIDIRNRDDQIRQKDDQIRLKDQSIRDKDEQFRKLNEQQARLQASSNKEAALETQLKESVKRESALQVQLNQITQKFTDLQKNTIPIPEFEQEMRKMEEHFIKLMDNNANVFMQQQQRYQQQINHLRHQIQSQTVTPLQAIQSELNTLKQTLNRSEQNWRAESQQLQLNIARLENQNTGLRQQAQQVLDLKRKLSNAENEITLIKNKQQQTLQNKSTLQAQLQKQRVKIANFQSQIRKYQGVSEEAQKLRSRLSTVEAQLNSLKSVQGQSSQLKQKIASLQAEITNFRNIQSELQQLKAKVMTLEAENSNLRNSKAQLEHLRGILSNMERQLGSLRDVQNEAHHFRGATANLEQELANMRQVQLENQQLRQSVAIAEAETAGLKNTQKQLILLKQKISNYETEIQTLRNVQAESQQQRMKISSLENELNSISQIQNEAQLHKSRANNLESEITRLRTVQIESQQLRLRQQQLEVDLNKMKSYEVECQQLRNQLQTMDKQLSRLHTFEIEVQQYRSKLAIIESELAGYRNNQAQSQQIRQKSTVLEAELSSLRGAQAEANHLRTLIGNLENQLNNLRGVQMELQQAKGWAASLEHQVNRLRVAQSEAQQLSLKASGLEQQLDHLKNSQVEAQQLRSKLLMAESQLAALRSLHNQTVQIKAKLSSLQIEAMKNQNLLNDNQQLKQAFQALNSEVRQRNDVQIGLRSQIKQLQLELQNNRRQSRLQDQEQQKFNHQIFKLKQDLTLTQQNLLKAQQQLPRQIVDGELNKQKEYFAKLLDENASMFQIKQKQMESVTIQLRANLQKQQQHFRKLLDENASIYKNREAQLQSQLTSSRIEIERLQKVSLATGQLEVIKMEGQRKQVRFRQELADSEAARERLQTRLESELNKLRLELTTAQKERDSRTQDNIERVKFYEMHAEKLTKSLAQSQARLVEAKNEVFKLRQLLHNFEMTKIRLQDQLKTMQQNQPSPIRQPDDSQSKYLVLVEQKHRLMVQLERLKMRSGDEVLGKRQLQQRFNEILKEKTALLDRVDKLQSLLYQKQMQMIKSFQKRQENIQQLIAQNKSLQSELKKIQERLLAHQFKNVLSPWQQPSPHQPRQSHGSHQAELQLLRDQNSFIRERIRFLESQLRQNRHVQQSQRGDTQQKYLLRTEGDRIKQNLVEAEQTNQDLLRKLNNLTRPDTSIDQYSSTEIIILQQISQQVTEVIQNNRLLAERITKLEYENEQLLKRAGQPTGDNSGEEMAVQILEILDGVAQFLNEQQAMSEDINNRYDHYLERMDGCIDKRNLSRYLQIFQEFIKYMFMALLEAKDQLLQKQAANLLELRDRMGDLIDQQIEQSEYDDRGSYPHTFYQEESSKRHELQSLQHLYRHYVKHRRIDTLKEIGKVLHVHDTLI